MASTDDVLIALEERLKRLEDQIEIYQLLSTYGPCADSGSGDIVETLYKGDGKYDSGIDAFDGAAAIREMIEELPLHRQLMNQGCAHMVTMPVVNVTGDRAVATCHGQLLRRDGDGFTIWRTSATRWDLERTSSGWKIARRVNRLLDGSPGAQELFRSALFDIGAGREAWKASASLDAPGSGDRPSPGSR
jgi:hypothetical protein